MSLLSDLEYPFSAAADEIYNAATGKLTAGQLEAAGQAAAAQVAAAGGDQQDQSTTMQDVVEAGQQPITVVPNVLGDLLNPLQGGGNVGSLIFYAALVIGGLYVTGRYLGRER